MFDGMGDGGEGVVQTNQSDLEFFLFIKYLLPLANTCLMTVISKMSSFLIDSKIAFLQNIKVRNDLFLVSHGLFHVSHLT